MLRRIATHLTNRFQSETKSTNNGISISNVRSKSDLRTHLEQHKSSTINLFSTGKTLSSLYVDIQKSFSPLTLKRELVSDTKLDISDQAPLEILLSTLSIPPSKKLAALSNVNANYFVQIAGALAKLQINTHENFEAILNLFTETNSKKPCFFKKLRDFFEKRARIEKEVTLEENEWIIKFWNTCSTYSQGNSNIQSDITKLYLDILQKGPTKDNLYCIEKMRVPTAYSALIKDLKQFYPQVKEASPLEKKRCQYIPPNDNDNDDDDNDYVPSTMSLR